MDIRWRSTPSRLTFAALALLAVVGFTGLIDRATAGTVILPPEVESPIERGGSDLSA